MAKERHQGSEAHTGGYVRSPMTARMPSPRRCFRYNRTEGTEAEWTENCMMSEVEESWAASGASSLGFYREFESRPLVSRPNRLSPPFTNRPRPWAAHWRSTLLVFDASFHFRSLRRSQSLVHSLGGRIFSCVPGTWGRSCLFDDSVETRRGSVPHCDLDFEVRLRHYRCGSLRANNWNSAK